MGIQTERRDPPKATSADLAPLRVLIVDDAPSTRTFLHAVLEHCDQFDVVGEADDGGMAIEKAGALQPDLVLLDISMPAVSGAGALKGILEVAPTTMVIIVSGSRTGGRRAPSRGRRLGIRPQGIAPFNCSAGWGASWGVRSASTPSTR